MQRNERRFHEKFFSMGKGGFNFRVEINFQTLKLSIMSNVLRTGCLLMSAGLLFFISCKKVDMQTEENIENLLASKVTAYLAKEKKMGNEGYAQRIQRLTDNLLFSQTYTEDLPNGKQMLITPISPSLKLVNNKESDVSNVLLLFLDKAGNVSRANVVQYEALSGSVKAVPKNLFHNLYTSKQMPDCRLTFLRMSDTYLYDFEYRNEQLTRYRYMQPKEEAAAGRTTACTDWYLVTTVYFGDGTSQQYEQYVTTTCTQACVAVSVVTPEGYTCDGTPIGGVGGGSVDGFGQGDWIAYTSPDGLNKVLSFEEFFGTIAPNNGSKFTSLKHVHDGVSNVMADGHRDFAIWSAYSWHPQLSSDRKTGTTTLSGRLRYPNRGNEIIEVLDKRATWTADIHLQ